MSTFSRKLFSVVVSFTKETLLHKPEENSEKINYCFERKLNLKNYLQKKFNKKHEHYVSYQKKYYYRNKNIGKSLICGFIYSDNYFCSCFLLRKLIESCVAIKNEFTQNRLALFDFKTNTAREMQGLHADFLKFTEIITKLKSLRNKVTHLNHK